MEHGALVCYFGADKINSSLIKLQQLMKLGIL